MKIVISGYSTITQNIKRNTVSNSVKETVTIDDCCAVEDVLVFDWEHDGSVGFLPVHVDKMSPARSLTDRIKCNNTVLHEYIIVL